MFRGNGWNLAIIGPFSAREFYIYVVYNNILFPGRQKNDLFLQEKLMCGGLTGMTAMLITYPLEVRTFFPKNKSDFERDCFTKNNIFGHVLRSRH